MSRLTELYAARDKYRTMVWVAAGMAKLDRIEEAAAMQAEAEEFGATEIHVPTSCVKCGGDCGIRLRADSDGQPGENGLCGPCNFETTAEVQRQKLGAAAEVPIAIVYGPEG